MPTEELDDYLSSVAAQTELPRYIERQFGVATNQGGADPDEGFQFRGVFRESEPRLSDLLKERCVIVLGEPGMGKSLVAKAAVQATVKNRKRIPLFAELNQYRASAGLRGLLSRNVPLSLIDSRVQAPGLQIPRIYVLDGIDEVPTDDLTKFSEDLNELLANDQSATVFATSRQAFFSSYHKSLPQFSSIFHILEFTEADVRSYVAGEGEDPDEFLNEVVRADSEDEIKNPFVLSTMLRLYKQQGELHRTRSENLSHIVDSLIRNRPSIFRHRQLRALHMIALAMETYGRNELTESEALEVIVQSMTISEKEGDEILKELYASILRRTANGFAFQLRSYGEYLAAEALEDADFSRIERLAFLNHTTPNDSWRNTISYLAELNARAKRIFIQLRPEWMLRSSPSSFEAAEKDAVARGVLNTIAGGSHYIQGYPGVDVRRVGRFLTTSFVIELEDRLESTDDVDRGNALLLLSWSQDRSSDLDSKIVRNAMEIVRRQSADQRLRIHAIYALSNCATGALVPELIELLDEHDPFHERVVELIGSICDESQISIVLPMVERASSLLSAAFRHFRQFRSRRALIETLRYLRSGDQILESLRIEGYLESIVDSIPRHWDADIASEVLALVRGMEDRVVYLSNRGIGQKIFAKVREADKEGLLIDLYLRQPEEDRPKGSKLFHVNMFLASLVSPSVADGLTSDTYIEFIRDISPYLQGEVRDILRPFSDGLITLQENNTRAFADEKAEEQSRQEQLKSEAQAKILGATNLEKALIAFSNTRDINWWPELPSPYKDWLQAEISRMIESLNLEESIRWNEQSLVSPSVSFILLNLVDHYRLLVTPDTPLIFATTAWHQEMVANYYQRNGLSDLAKLTLERCVRTLHPQKLRGILEFLSRTDIWSDGIRSALEGLITLDTDEHRQLGAIQLLSRHNPDLELLQRVSREAKSETVREAAFLELVKVQHRATIERALHGLLQDENKLRSEEENPPIDAGFGWIAHIKSDFAIPKLEKLREIVLRLELPGYTGVVTDTLVRIDRRRAIAIIKKQVRSAAPSWRRAQELIAIEQEQTLRADEQRLVPFTTILAKLRNSTSFNRLKVVCEGSTDVAVFKKLVAQLPDIPEIAFDFAGGWPNLEVKDPTYFEHGCKAAVVVMDGDLGRHLTKRNKPLTKRAKKEKLRLTNLSVELIVLERYGIENYFPQKALEMVLNRDLTAYFPVPDASPIGEYLVERSEGTWDRVRRFIGRKVWRRLGGQQNSFYRKSLAEDVAEHISLIDLRGTDLHSVVEIIGQRARELER